jgi:hypothetical protein
MRVMITLGCPAHGARGSAPGRRVDLSLGSGQSLPSHWSEPFAALSRERELAAHDGHEAIEARPSIRRKNPQGLTPWR